MLWRHEGGSGEGYGAGGGGRRQATMNAVDGGGATAAAAAADGDGVDGTFFAPFLWSFHGCFSVVLKVKWCRFGDKTDAIFGKKWFCFRYCLAVVLGASCWD